MQYIFDIHANCKVSGHFSSLAYDSCNQLLLSQDYQLTDLRIIDSCNKFIKIAIGRYMYAFLDLAGIPSLPTILAY